SALTTPVAFIIFNRKVRLFAQRSRRRVFVIADAPDPELKTDAVTRAIIDGVDWPCQLLRARSRGCDDRCRCSSRCVIRKKNRERDGRSLRPGKFLRGNYSLATFILEAAPAVANLARAPRAARARPLR